MKLDGLRYHYIDEGEGEPVVMLHGNPTWCYYYRNLVGTLKDSHRCIVPDHIGMGMSDKPTDKKYSYTFERRVDDLEALLDRLGIKENITLVVHDWGGMIGMTYASRHPERIARLVILNTAAFHLPKTKPFPWQLWLVRNTALGAFLVRGFNAFSIAAAYMCCTRKSMRRETRKAYCAPYNSWKNRIATLRFVQDIPLLPRDKGYDTVTKVQDRLHDFRTTPTLICWGMKDFVFDEHFLLEWRRILPNAAVHEYDDCGHYILEDGGPELLKTIKEFITNQ